MDRKLLKKVVKTIGVIVFVLALIRIYYELKWIDVLLGIYNLETKRKKVALVSNKGMMFISKTKDGEQPLYDEMSKYGWDFVNRYGNGFVFTNADEEILLKKKSYLVGYTTYEICTEESISDGHKLFV